MVTTASRTAPSRTALLTPAPPAGPAPSAVLVERDVVLWVGDDPDPQRLADLPRQFRCRTVGGIRDGYLHLRVLEHPDRPLTERVSSVPAGFRADPQTMRPLLARPLVAPPDWGGNRLTVRYLAPAA